MVVSLRCMRMGRKKMPFYRIVAIQSQKKRSGEYLEKLGHYDPMQLRDTRKRADINLERFRYWISHGAQPSERVAKLFAIVSNRNNEDDNSQEKQ